MAHPYLVKDIAFQAGLGTATVDRVLNNRPGVRRQTALRVHAAIAELERQDVYLERAGRLFMIDVVMETPDRFAEAARAAFEREAGALAPAIFRSRFHLSDVYKTSDMVKVLDRIRLRGSDGIVLKAANAPEISAAIKRVEAAGIPVVTLVTDLPTSARSAYAGADNRAAGETAAYLIANRYAGRGGRVLLTLSSSRFQGEEEREAGFRAHMQARHPEVRMTSISEGLGRDTATGALAAEALRRFPDISAVYSIGGGNRALVSAFEEAGRLCEIFVGHDLDADNLKLLRSGALTFVLHHDLKSDVREAFRAIQARHEKKRGFVARLSPMEVITPFNIPREFD